MPAVIAAGAAPAFASSPVGGGEPTIVPEPRTPVAASPQNLRLNFREGTTDDVTTTGATTLQPGGAQPIGNGRGTVTVNFTLPENWDTLTDKSIVMTYSGSEHTIAHYIVNGTATTTDGLTVGDGKPEPTYTIALDGSQLKGGANTITFGNPADVYFAYLAEVNIGYTIPGVTCP